MGLLDELNGLYLPNERHSWRLRELSEEKMDAFKEQMQGAKNAITLAEECMKQNDREGCEEALDKAVKHVLKAKEQVA